MLVDGLTSLEMLPKIKEAAGGNLPLVFNQLAPARPHLLLPVRPA